MDKKDIEFSEKLANLLDEYEVDINVDIWSGYDGGGLESIYFEDSVGNKVLEFSHNYVSGDDIREKLK